MTTSLRELFSWQLACYFRIQNCDGKQIVDNLRIWFCICKMSCSFRRLLYLHLAHLHFAMARDPKKLEILDESGAAPSIAGSTSLTRVLYCAVCGQASNEPDKDLEDSDKVVSLMIWMCILCCSVDLYFINAMQPTLVSHTNMWQLIAKVIQWSRYATYKKVRRPMGMECMVRKVTWMLAFVGVAFCR